MPGQCEKRIVIDLKSAWEETGPTQAEVSSVQFVAPICARAEPMRGRRDKRLVVRNERNNAGNHRIKSCIQYHEARDAYILETTKNRRPASRKPFSSSAMTLSTLGEGEEITHRSQLLSWFIMTVEKNANFELRHPFVISSDHEAVGFP